MISDIRTSEDKSLEGAAVDHRAVGYLRRDAPLYDQRFPLFLPGDDQPKDSLVLRILEGSRPSTVVGQTEKIFHFEVIKARNPCYTDSLFLSV